MALDNVVEAVRERPWLAGVAVGGVAAAVVLVLSAVRREPSAERSAESPSEGDAVAPAFPVFVQPPSVEPVDPYQGLLEQITAVVRQELSALQPPTPQPTPEPQPSPEPQPTPQPTPEPQPSPEPQPTPQPSPAPAPSQTAELHLPGIGRVYVANANTVQQVLDQVRANVAGSDRPDALAPRPRSADPSREVAPGVYADVQGRWLYFADTGHYVAHGFKNLYEQTGGVARWGRPLSEEFSIGNMTYQLFERGFMQYVRGSGDWTSVQGFVMW